MQKIKVVHILHSVGGVDVSLRLITKHINTEKVENVIIHGDDDTNTPFTDINNKELKEYKLPVYRNINFLKDLKVLKNTIQILKDEQPDLIHAHSAKGGVIAKICGKMLNIPVLHTPQAYSYLSAEGFKKQVFLQIEKGLKRLKNNKILASSNSESNRAIKEIGYTENRVLLFNNSIPPITDIKPLSINKTWPDNYICSVGRPSYQKNIELMLDVLAEIKQSVNNIHLVLMGVGYHSPNLEGVQAKIDRLGLKDNITLLEWTTREDIFSIIKDSKLYLTTARYEGLPYSVIESLALGKAIVATDADGNRDLVKDGYNGYLVFNENASEMANSVVKIFNSEKLNQEFSNNSLKMFYKEFDITNNIQLLEKIYLKTLDCSN